MINLVVCGAAGKMGASIIRLAAADDVFRVVGAVEHTGNASIGTGTLKITDNFSEALFRADVAIDFTSPAATMEHLAVALAQKKAIVIGTTGLSPDQVLRIKDAAKTIPIVFSPNMSIGVNLLFTLARAAAKAVPGYDVEIVELHHNQKKDAPSGTAAHLAQVIAETRGSDMAKDGVYGRKGLTGPRKQEEIGVMSVRAGDIVGDHTVYFAGPGERIELVHRAHSRDTFAAGALRAAHWLAKKSAGLYDMQDVLNPSSAL
ncbi:MAG: 4-hydroxy-tetrahydrodipicolinate reductase [Elusimicrobia bacterium]|nr:4-hydroxy-tetrahydrodipicolinate reductase [Elusimicrobiota bacterium]